MRVKSLRRGSLKRKSHPLVTPESIKISRLLDCTQGNEIVTAAEISKRDSCGNLNGVNCQL